MVRWLRSLWLLVLLLPVDAAAQVTFNVPGVNLTIQQVLGKLVERGAFWIIDFCIMLFLVGAFVKVAAAGKEEQSKRGNQIMIGSLIGLAIVTLSYTFIKALFFVIY